MFSPVKAITAGALVFALGGLFLVAQPFDQQTSIRGAEQGADYPDPVYVTSTFIRLDCEEATGHTDGSTEADGPVNRGYGSTCTVYREWSDPRLQGPERWFLNAVEYDDESFFIGHQVRVIVTDEGAWRMRPVFLFESEDGPGNEVGTLVLDGEDAYEGLSVVLDDNDRGDPLSGFIISTDLVPPAPEEGSTK